MGEAFSAFGLALDAGFPLPEIGAEPEVGGGGRPEGSRVTLELTSPEALEEVWSGGASPTPWRGRLGDGEVLAVERGRGGDLLFRYGGRASFRFDPERDAVECAPGDPAARAWRRVLLTRVLPNVAIARGDEALHASAVTCEAGTIAILAASGGGKSTLALELVRRGRLLFADDTVVLRRRGAAIEAHPAGPFMNLDAATPAPAGARSLGSFDGELWVAAATAATAPAPLAAIVFLERTPGGRLGVQSLSANPLELAPFMLGLPDDEDRDGPRFALYADLVERTPLLRLSADTAHRPEELARVLEPALGERPWALAGELA